MSGIDNNTSEKIGKIHATMEFLAKDVQEIKTTVKGLNCGDHKEKISELYGWYSDQKETQKQVKFTVLRSLLNYAVAGVVGAVAAFLGFKAKGG